ncbi:MAG: AmmeMemoRadiSam system protein A [Gammaproteobacteria bacterium]|nr:AmmeMemoRadiSam system protein A [Gammaproteobacteria bacterium]MDH5692143.1 AmmeMemoRadiSam system protein A [Gammaproteobacteria bacterium]
MPTPSTDMLAEKTKNALLTIAVRSIQYTLEHREIWSPDISSFSDPGLLEEGASFVTLKKRGELRGCIGSLEAYQALVLDVAKNAHSAAFRDPRFQALSPSELEGLEISISVLTEPEAMEFSSEEEVLKQIRPGVDGLILEDDSHRGTFLPAVWESLPRKEDFWHQLKLKAGLPAHYWSAHLRVFRYETISFGSSVKEILNSLV